MAGGNEETADQKNGGNAAENPPLILPQRRRSVDRRAQAAARTIRTSLCLHTPTPALSVFVCGSGQRSFTREFERQRLPEPRVGGDLYVGVGLSGKVRQVVAGALSRLEVHRFRRDGNEMLQRINALGIDVHAARVGHGINNIEARLAGS